MPKVPRTRRNKQYRDSGRFGRCCGCINHDNFVPEGNYKLLTTANQSRRASFQELVRRNLLPQTFTPKWICSGCLNYAAEHFIDTTAQHEIGGDSQDRESCDSEDGQESAYIPSQSGAPCEHGDVLKSTLHKIQELVENVNVGDNENETNVLNTLKAVSGVLGHAIERSLYRDGKNCLSEYKKLEQPDMQEWLSSQNPILLEFLTGCTGVSPKTESAKKHSALVHSVEQILYTRNLIVVCPFAFRRNVVQYSYSKSKMCTSMNGSWEPAGGYTTVSKFVTSPCDPLECPPGHVEVTVDNNQKVHKSSGRIMENSTVPVDICTTVGFLHPPDASHLQEKECLKPDQWRERNLEKLPEIVASVTAQEEEHMDTFRAYREKYIEETIHRVVSEQRCSGDVLSDYVDVAKIHKEQNLQTVVVCVKCAHVYPRNSDSVKCPLCGHDPKAHNPGYDPYSKTPSQHPKQPSTMTIGEPCMVNPSSEKTVHQVLLHVKEACKIPEERQWVVLWSDGVPYIHTARLEENTYVCTLCDTLFDTRVTTINEHISSDHKGDTAAYGSVRKLFDFLVSRPGPGHIELNMARTVLKFGWDPLFSSFTKGLGFRTPRAAEVVRNGVDHHRSRQILATSLEGLACEVVVPYVRECHQIKQDPTVQGFSKFMARITSQSYIYYFEMAFTFLLAFHLYTEAVRKNHHSHMMAARVAFAPLFFVGHHPFYREIHMRDMIDRVQYPPELEAHVNAHESFCLSTEDNRGQGADFLHEELNRTVKDFLPIGRITNEIWQRVCRKASSLKEMRTTCLNTVSSEVDLRRYHRFDLEVTMLRAQLRAAATCLSPHQPGPVVSLSGETLDHGLCDAKVEARANYALYKQHVATTGKFTGLKLRPVFVTPEQRKKHESIENKTKAEIAEEATKLISCLPGAEQVPYLDQVRSLKANHPKIRYTELYNEIEECITQSQAEGTVGQEADNE